MKYLWLLLLLPLMALPVTASAGAKSIDELAKMYDSSGCKDCHKEIYEQWENSHHARSLMGINDAIFLIPVVKKSPFSPKEPKLAKKENFPCFKCHLPQALDAEDSFFAEVAQAIVDGDKAKIKKLQLGCTVCHNDRAILHKADLGDPEKGVIYGTKDNPKHPGGVVKKSVIMGQSVFCGQCHGLGPNFDARNPYQCATLYGNYLHTYIPAGGTKTCQECHMKGGDHLIAPNWNDRPGSAALLKENIDLDVDTAGYQFLYKAGMHIPMIVVTTRVSHHAGHEVPNGWPSPNRVVLEVTAKTEDGKEIYKEEKIYMPQATTQKDEKMTYGAQFKVGYVRNTSLHALHTTEDTFEIKLPEGVRTANVEVELTYQLFPGDKIPIHKVSKKVTLDR